MNTQKTVATAISMIVITALLASPALAHRKYRPNPGRWVLVRHSHRPSESAKPTASKQPKAKSPGLLGGAASIVTGTLDSLGNAVKAVFGGKARPANEMRNEDLQQASPHRANRSFVPRHPSGSPRWVR